MSFCRLARAGNGAHVARQPGDTIMGWYGHGGSRIGNATHKATIAAWLDGRDLKGSRMFSEAGKIYSYGYHFTIATWAETDGERVALITERHYSPTTSGHVGAVRWAAQKAGMRLLRSKNMGASYIHRHDDAMAFARAAVDHMHAKRHAVDLANAREAESMMATARAHEQLYGSPIPELDAIESDLRRAVAAYEGRSARIFRKATARELAKLFALEGVMGAFVSAGAYFVPNYEGKLERRLCAYWRLSDGRFARMVKGWREVETTFLDALPADLVRGA